jgi:hypothetical protein
MRKRHGKQLEGLDPLQFDMDHGSIVNHVWSVQDHDAKAKFFNVERLTIEGAARKAFELLGTVNAMIRAWT